MTFNEVFSYTALTIISIIMFYLVIKMNKKLSIDED